MQATLFLLTRPPADAARIAVPVLLGLLGVYLLLPRPKAYSPWLGSIVLAAALVAAGFMLIRHEFVNPETVLFYAFAGIAIAAGGLMITQRNPVRAALSFALVVMSTCGLFLLQAAPFLMAATITVYAGAIIVTFAFVIMLAQQAGISDADARSREPLLASIAGFVLLAAVLAILQSAYGTGSESKEEQRKLAEAATLPRVGEAPYRYSTLSVEAKHEDKQGRPALPAENVAYLGRTLFTDYLVAVELGGTLLLVATIGAIAITGRRAGEPK